MKEIVAPKYYLRKVHWYAYEIQWLYIFLTPKLYSVDPFRSVAGIIYSMTPTYVVQGKPADHHVICTVFMKFTIFR